MNVGQWPWEPGLGAATAGPAHSAGLGRAWPGPGLRVSKAIAPAEGGYGTISEVEPSGRDSQRAWTTSMSPQSSPLPNCPWAVCVEEGREEEDNPEGKPLACGPPTATTRHWLLGSVPHWDSQTMQPMPAAQTGCPFPLGSRCPGGTKVGCYFSTACSRPQRREHLNVPWRVGGTPT